MDKNLKLVVTENIGASAGKVWRALTDKATIKKWMWGTDAVSDWQPGSPITFEGVWEGKPYSEKGQILEIEKEKVVRYSFLSTGSEDKPENYSTITYQLSSGNGKTTVTVHQEGANNQEALEHSKKGWESMLTALREIVEASPT